MNPKHLISNREYITAYKFSLLAGAVFTCSLFGKDIVHNEIRKLNVVSRAISMRILGKNIVEKDVQEAWHETIEIPKYFLSSYNEKLKYYEILKGFIDVSVLACIITKYNLDFSAEKLSELCVALNIFDNSNYNFKRIELKTDDGRSVLTSNITGNYIYIKNIMSEKIVDYIESNFKSALKESCYGLGN